MDSHMPYKESGAVPATMKSGAVSMAPRESMPHKYGVQVPGSRPAITGETNHGPNLHAHQLLTDYHAGCMVMVAVEQCQAIGEERDLV